MMIKDQILKLIKNKKGITTSSICQKLSETDKQRIKAIINELVDEGKIATVRSKNYPVLRQILVFDKETENLVEEINLPDLTADVLQTAFNNYDNDPLFYEVYDLNEKNSNFFIKTYKLKFKFNKHHYQLTAAFEASST